MQDILAHSYQYIYIFTVAILSIPVIMRYNVYDGHQNHAYPNNSIRDMMLLLVLFLFIGLRPVSYVFSDMVAYSQNLTTMGFGDFQFNWDTDNKIFDNLFGFWISENLGDTSFFILMAIIYFVAAYIGVKRLFPGHVYPVYLTFLAAFSTFSFATNGIKAGAAASLFIMSLGFIDRKWLCLLLVLVSLGFHHSMQLPVIALIITMFYKNPKWYFYGWLFCLLMAVLHITFFQNLFGSLTDEQGAGYLVLEGKTITTHIRFRPDFILYSAVPVWFGYQFEMKRKKTSRIYSTLLHLYICINGIWMLCMYSDFNQRIAYLSWFLYPIVLFYPFLFVDNRRQRYRYFSKVMMYHLLFTIFMDVVYYGILGLGY